MSHRVASQQNLSSQISHPDSQRSVVTLDTAPRAVRLAVSVMRRPTRVYSRVWGDLPSAVLRYTVTEYAHATPLASHLSGALCLSTALSRNIRSVAIGSCGTWAWVDSKANEAS